MTDLDGSAGAPAQRFTAPSGMSCPECGQIFPVGHSRKAFCSDKHRKDFLNRWTGRGSVIALLAAASRITRGGSRGDTATGVRARQEFEHLVARWTREDREAGRWPADRYLALRYRNGFAST